MIRLLISKLLQTVLQVTGIQRRLFPEKTQLGIVAVLEQVGADYNTGGIKHASEVVDLMWKVIPDLAEEIHEPKTVTGPLNLALQELRSRVFKVKPFRLIISSLSCCWFC